MRGKSLLEVLGVFGLLVLLVDLYKSTGLFQVELGVLGWSYIGALQLAIPLAIIVLARRDYSSYGFTLREWRHNLGVGLTCFLALLLPYGAVILLPTFGFSYLEPKGALLLAASYSASTVLILILLRKKERDIRRLADETTPFVFLRKEASKARRNLFLIVGLLVLPILIGLYVGGPSHFSLKVPSTVFYQFFISGFGEEMLFRGYVQSRVNLEFGRPYRFLGANFGAGLFVSSFLFGFLHMLNTFSPFTASFSVLPWWGVSAFFSGLFFGFVREKTGSIISVGIAHGLPDAVGESFGLLFPGVA